MVENFYCSCRRSGFGSQHYTVAHNHPLARITYTHTYMYAGKNNKKPLMHIHTDLSLKNETKHSSSGIKKKIKEPAGDLKHGLQPSNGGICL